MVLVDKYQITEENQTIAQKPTSVSEPSSSSAPKNPQPVLPPPPPIRVLSPVLERSKSGKKTKSKKKPEPIQLKPARVKTVPAETDAAKKSATPNAQNATDSTPESGESSKKPETEKEPGMKNGPSIDPAEISNKTETVKENSISALKNGPTDGQKNQKSPEKPKHLTTNPKPAQMEKKPPPIDLVEQKRKEKESLLKKIVEKATVVNTAKSTPNKNPTIGKHGAILISPRANPEVVSTAQVAAPDLSNFKIKKLDAGEAKAKLKRTAREIASGNKRNLIFIK